MRNTIINFILALLFFFIFFLSYRLVTVKNEIRKKDKMITSLIMSKDSLQKLKNVITIHDTLNSISYKTIVKYEKVIKSDSVFIYSVPLEQRVELFNRFIEK